MANRKQFLSLIGGGAASFSIASLIRNGSEITNEVYNVNTFGAVGDGKTPSANAFQEAIDKAESDGGGVVLIPPGKYILEKTPLIGSNVHLKGSGPGTVLTGERTGNYQGAALISNKGQQASGYDGASGWSISNLAIDSPKTNGIVVTHASNVYISHIYGIEAFHHFIDTAGLNILCENLFLTGHSGTSTFQIDSLGNAQSIWDGQQAVSPNLDGTQTKNLILRSSIITATAGTEGNRPRHDTSIHFHGEVSEGIILSDLILGGAENGIYMDDGLSYSNMQISNITSYNHGRAIWFEESPIRQEQISIRGLIHQPEINADKAGEYCSITIYATDGLSLCGLQLKSPEDLPCKNAIELYSCSKAELSGIKAKGFGGTAILISDDLNRSDKKSNYIQIHGSIFEGFEYGLSKTSSHEDDEFIEWGNLFIDVKNQHKGTFKTLTTR
ncbi:MAG: hypothetical protein EA391_00390 [Balneolaceae bacterium]|nr:MAG: hypothetical protein EA391_00390 [Balneolaceae bacterium]